MDEKGRKNIEKDASKGWKWGRMLMWERERESGLLEPDIIFDVRIKILTLKPILRYISSDGDTDLLWKQILFHISGGLVSISIFIKEKNLFVLKISKTFVFFLRTLGEYLRRYEQGSVLEIRFQGSVVKTNLCPSL